MESLTQIEKDLNAAGFNVIINSKDLNVDQDIISVSTMGSTGVTEIPSGHRITMELNITIVSKPELKRTIEEQYEYAMELLKKPTTLYSGEFNGT